MSRAGLRVACACSAAVLGSVFSLLAAPGSALANGAFPSSGQILVDPTDAARVAIRATYGLVETSDAGATFHWTCESALGYSSDNEHPQLGITSDGTVFAGLLDGMFRGRLGGCEWSRVASLEGQIVIDVSYPAAGPGRAIAGVLDFDSGRGEVWASVDEAATWSKLGATLPVKFLPLTLDAAPSDPDRIYVSGLVEGTQTRGAIAASTDAGETWTLGFIPDADASKAPYIGGVDPIDPGVLWVRLDAAPGELFVSRDGGETWELALLIEGFLRAFALSPDGSEVIAGGDADGLSRADAISLDWAPMNAVAARCAKWRDGVIDVCGTEALDGFTMGRSTDDGATFAPFYSQACLLGPEPCDAETPVGACEADWPAVRDQIGAVGCGEGGSSSASVSSGGPGPSTADASAASGGPGATSSAAFAASSGAGLETTAGSGEGAGDAVADDESGSGCSCRSTPSREAASIADLIGLFGLACAAGGAARARSRGSKRPTARAGKRRR